MTTNASAFEYGAELQGRGEPTTKDIVIGSFMFLCASSAVILGVLNIYLIKRMDIFHNAFGWFWASRTLGEVVNNLLHVLYSAPVTIMQPSRISPYFGILVFLLGYLCAFGSCMMHQVVSLNRCIAVCCPIAYKFIFTKETCKKVILAVWIPVPFIISLFVILPCNLIGYSPQLYEYAFIKCSPNMDREYSLLGTIINRTCAVICCFTVLTDFVTLCRIIYIRKVLKMRAQNADFNRDTRFFAQTTVQNLTMIVAVAMIAIANNEFRLEDEVLHILGFNTLLVTHVNNALALLVFNPEIRHRFRRSFKRVAGSIFGRGMTIASVSYTQTAAN